VIRDMLSDMGCDGTLPRNDKDTVDMMRVLQELTYSAAERREMRDDEDVDRELNDTDRRHLSDTASLLSTSSEKGPTRTGASAGHNTSKHHSKHGNRSSKLSAGDCDEEEDEGVGDSDGRNEPLLHSGPVLGNLPALSPHKPISTTTSNTTSTGKKKKRGSSLSMQSAAASDVPPEFVCELCQKQMSDPVKSTYGNVFERSVIENWLKTQGHICPLTGAPLGETDLSPLDDLKVRIRKWILQRSIQPASDRPVAVEDGSADGEGGVAPGKTRMSAPRGSPHRTSTDDDLYDF
ncbi:PUB12, partial [Symbiodinium microadriaticum]